MNVTFTKRNLFILLAALFLLALIADFVSESEAPYRMEAGSFERKLHKAERKGMECLEKIAHGDSLLALSKFADYTLSNEIYSLFKYSGGSLTAWTDNSISVPGKLNNKLFDKKLLQLDNRKVLANKLEYGRDTYICLINIYYEYDISNKYLKSGFNQEFGLRINTDISNDGDSGYPVHDISGQYLFSLVFDRSANFINGIYVIALFMWLLFSVFFLIAVDRIAAWLVKKGFSYLAFLSSVQFVVIFYLIFLLFDKPAVFTGMEIFSPFRFTLGPLIPSPGHLLFLSTLLLFICFEFYRYYPEPSCSEEKPVRSFLIISLFLTVSSFMFFLFSRLLHILILNSNIHFRIFDIVDIDIFSVISFAAAAMLLVGFSIYMLRLVKFCKNLPLRVVIPSMIIAGLLICLLNILSGQRLLVPALAYLLLALQAWFFRSGSSRLINISVTFALLAAAYSAYVIPDLTFQKETENLKVISANFSNQNDIYGEALLLDLWPELEADSLLPAIMNHNFLSPAEVNLVYSYLDSVYFTGYWDNYDRIYTICEDDSPLYFESDTQRVENCFAFFRGRAKEMGVPVIDSNLVFLDNNSGRPYYLGCLYYQRDDGNQNGLFIELINLVRYTQTGYPELLMNKEFDKQANTGDYSIAKYVHGSLVLQTGEYPFDTRLSLPEDASTTYLTLPGDEKMEFFVYTDNDISVLVARPLPNFMDIVVTFTYLFIAFFILFLAVLLILMPPESIFPGKMNFTQKLQVAFISLLLGTLLAIGTVVVILSINQYRGKHYENIEEKIGSVYIELEHKLSDLDSLDSDWSAESYANLDALLVKFSNVFKTDINLYDTRGQLLATSRREVFEKDLKSERMNFAAFNELKNKGGAQYIINERIGRLEYLSAYSTFANNRKEILAYLNLPYFNMQSRISEETSNLIVAMINFTMILLVISLSIAVFISVRITSPLRMLQQGLASVRLEEKSKPLEYRGHDEISELVKQYNTMLDELQSSALKLARSEREDAWREMAKQIAHEIKNPLTPMKLNVQQLYKKYKDNPENFEESLKNFKQYQIEQIDNLSSIATEFSSFARMPKASPGETNLVNHINAVADLYSDIKNIDFNINFNGLSEAIIFADKEQVNSMLSNIFRNAVQAMPGKRKGMINVSLSVNEQKALIRIEDNGMGIPDELKDKLFTPNFTTKSSGMGLGLSIVKRVVETADGKIWFESEPDKGTVFFVEFPLLSYKK
ncbi:MAG: HAMP domain-containing sensor histidine kinase [Bacteroidales bacterium]|nr:HAMP domain-containing sensor histidine kinase [Bacteroidales bacterium]